MDRRWNFVGNETERERMPVVVINASDRSLITLISLRHSPATRFISIWQLLRSIIGSPKGFGEFTVD
jgi:hypothetical protein